MAEERRAKISVISSNDCCVRLDSVRTSDATTAKPRPCSPARAASMAAFKASKLVCSEISLMPLTIEVALDTDDSRFSKDFLLLFNLSTVVWLATASDAA